MLCNNGITPCTLTCLGGLCAGPPPIPPYAPDALKPGTIFVLASCSVAPDFALVSLKTKTLYPSTVCDVHENCLSGCCLSTGAWSVWVWGVHGVCGPGGCMECVGLGGA